MNLENKAKEYATKINTGSIEWVAEDFKQGYLSALEDLIDFLKANPKANASQIINFIEGE